MATKFHFEHRFRAASTGAVFAAYFDDHHRDEQDRAVDVVRREILSDTDTPATRRRVSKVWPRRQLPALVRTMVKGDLSYDETIVWIKAGDRIEFDIRPTLLDGRARIEAAYQLRVDGPGAIVRSYHGEVAVDVKLLAGRIERAIVADLERTLAIAAAVTQTYLDRGAPA